MILIKQFSPPILVWLTTLKSSTVLVPERCTVPFLPVNPEFSSTRNQGRQKLARFNAREFATLIIDILSDAKRRQSPTVSSAVLSQGKYITSLYFFSWNRNCVMTPLNRFDMALHLL